MQKMTAFGGRLDKILQEFRMVAAVGVNSSPWDSAMFT